MAQFITNIPLMKGTVPKRLDTRLSFFWHFQQHSNFNFLENEENKRKRSIVLLEDICTGASQWCKSLMMTVKVEFSINTVELAVKYLYNHLNPAANCLRTWANQFSATTSISTLEPITGRKSETAILSSRNIDGSRIGKTIRRSRYYWTMSWIA